MAGQASWGSWDLVRFLAASSGIKSPRTEVSVPVGLEDLSGPGLSDSTGQEHLRCLQRTSWGPCPEVLKTRPRVGRCPEGPIGGGLYVLYQAGRGHHTSQQRPQKTPASERTAFQLIPHLNVPEERTCVREERVSALSSPAKASQPLRGQHAGMDDGTAENGCEEDGCAVAARPCPGFHPSLTLFLMARRRSLTEPPL